MIMIVKCIVILVIIKIINGVSTFRKISNGANKMENSIYNSYFPDVTYPTNIFEMTEPFFYKPNNVFDDSLRPFTDDVKASYKYVSSTIPRSNKIISKTLGGTPKGNVLKDVSLCVTQPNGTVACAKLNDKNSNQQDDPVWLITEEYTGINNTENVCEIIEEVVSEYMLKNNITFAEDIDTKKVNISSETPSNVKINIDVIKGVVKADNSTLTSDVDVLLVKAAPETLSKLNNESSSQNEELQHTGLNFTEQFTHLEELDKSNLYDSLSKVLHESSDNTQNISSEVLILQPLKEERISLTETKTNSNILENLIDLNNVKLIIITAKNKNTSQTDLETDNKADKEVQVEKNELEDNYFLDFVISLSDLFQDSDLQMLNNLSEPVTTVQSNFLERRPFAGV